MSLNWSRISSRKRMRRQGVEDVKGKTPLDVKLPKSPHCDPNGSQRVPTLHSEGGSRAPFAPNLAPAASPVGVFLFASNPISICVLSA
jgi:hypothetical protein